ncbi:ADP-ribosylation factor GTPase activating protein [Angomonas deanei]|uniref:GTPase activating protein for Arf, putative n=1 Tax=Angomonas deanei TaxID=59799 RepID=A0A7G2C3X4_9TRYP|nr:ADP-ribosylation factor GTPase activating protein [Angomonas deanei]CAD2213417.1 Putative GTPase activating protein for Arf, putative [Angomonas deanei]|eukprot:EPY41883.1 ADP-ribosylation factor GTPase activating protein [Angomonas deanei]
MEEQKSHKKHKKKDTKAKKATEEAPRKENPNNDLNREKVEQLCSAPPNNECADCQQPGTRWAVVNLGIFVCLRCSGVHRSLGVQVSKVKSSNLDSWSDAELTLMQILGNKVANEFYEAQMTAGEKLSPTSTDDEAAHFIKRKYVDREFASSNVDRFYKAAFKKAHYGKYAKQPGDDEPVEGEVEMRVEEVTKTAAVDPQVAMQELYGAAKWNTKKEKKAKKEMPVHGVFGVVNVPAEDYEDRLKRVFGSFGIPLPTADSSEVAAEVPVKADGDVPPDTPQTAAEEEEEAIPPVVEDNLANESTP